MKSASNRAVDKYSCPKCVQQFQEYHSYASHWWQEHDEYDQHALCALAGEGVLMFLYVDLRMSCKEIGIRYGVAKGTVRHALDNIDENIVTPDRASGNARKTLQTKPLEHLKEILEQDLEKIR